MTGKTHPGGRKASLDHALRGMFRALENRPTPDRIRSVLDQLDSLADHDDLKKAG